MPWFSLSSVSFSNILSESVLSRSFRLIRDEQKLKIKQKMMFYEKIYILNDFKWFWFWHHVKQYNHQKMISDQNQRSLVIKWFEIKIENHCIWFKNHDFKSFHFKSYPTLHVKNIITVSEWLIYWLTLCTETNT